MLVLWWCVSILQVAWIKADTKGILAIHTTKVALNHRLSVTHNGHNTWKLHISHVQLNDSGPYMCQGMYLWLLFLAFPNAQLSIFCSKPNILQWTRNRCGVKWVLVCSKPCKTSQKFIIHVENYLEMGVRVLGFIFSISFSRIIMIEIYFASSTRFFSANGDWIRRAFTICVQIKLKIIYNIMRRMHDEF